ncbi:carbohydrate ABC transporter substrate-binding protein [Xylanimonas oleitrophica]|uniref:Carbohydrate ABC transporter substrate-binding protein n=1 Tax=Xylanimonas oleitrophica TaxID=2607479 RepID=A0A2W5WL85_9MICO|nr:ABC transporter substrate-binding protein [Xylanimonas oleitrophica]PZR52037.1 carbohydrate ABC transporter substrate-binding protein [Xylanimonas oleitrophica]
MRIDRKARTIAALAATTALVATACSGGQGGSGGGDGGKPDVLTVAAWMDFPQELLDRFEEEHGIKVEINSFPDGASAQTVLRNGLASNGAGLSDVHLIELDWWTEMMAVPEDWATLPAVEDRWVDWKVTQGSVDGEIKGYGTDIGPLALAYDSTLMEEAGLPSDPEGFAELVGGQDATWETFLEAGRQFTARSDAAWIDSNATAMQAAINQLPAAFEDPQSGDTLPLADNAAVHELFDTFAQAAQEGVSAGVGIGHADWGAGFQARRWATVITPAWATGIIAENAAGLEGWRIADVFPNGGGNWGGSFFSVPATGPNVEWATTLADFLTTPEAAVEMFLLNGQFPSQTTAMEDPAVSETPHEFFGGQQVGEIYGGLAAAAGDAAAGGFRGVNFAGIQTLVMDGLRRVESGNQDASTAWDSTVAEFDALGLTD